MLAVKRFFLDLDDSGGSIGPSHILQPHTVTEIDAIDATTRAKKTAVPLQVTAIMIGVEDIARSKKF